MRTKANGITLNYQIDGPDGAPWVAFSNSLATSLHMWDQQASDLAGEFRVLRYDQRGHGESDVPEGRYTFALLIDDVIALFDALGIARAHFVGLSMGGVTALGLAQRHADRIDRVVVCDSPGKSTTASAQQWEERIVVARREGMEPLVEPTLARWFPPETVKKNPPHLDHVREMIRTTPVNGFIGCAAALADHDYRAAVPTITRPALFMAGEKDGTTPQAMRQMQAELAGSRFVELPGAGHISNLDQPALFSRSLREFFAAGDK